MRKRLIAVVGLVALLGLALYPSMTRAQQRPGGAVCPQVPLTQKPGWTISGAWSPEGLLLLVDPLNRAILRYTNSGRPLGAIGGPLQSALGNSLPTVGKFRGSDLILQVTDGLMILDRNYRPTATQSVRVEGTKRKDPLAIGMLWQWEPVGQRDIMAFGDVHGPNPDDRRSWYSAYLRFPLDNPSAFKVFRPLGPDDDETNLLRLGFPYIASIGDTAYILSMGSKVTLFRNEAGSEELEPLGGLPPGLDLSPSTSTRFESWPDYVSTMKGIEKAALPVGLYAWNDSLYILARSPQGQGQGTRWTLSSIDPVRERYTGSVDLPIKANHVLAVPGPRQWAFVEKGPVLGKGLQDVSRVLFVPSEQLRAPLSRSGAGCRR